MLTLINEFISFQVHGGASGGGLIMVISSLLEFLESLGGKTPPEMFAAIFPGIAAMGNIHPLFVHFPIAFFLGFFVMECLGLWKAKPQWRYVASWLLYLGTAATFFTVTAGFIAADTVEHDDVVHEIMERHEHIGVTVLLLASFLTCWRVWHWGNFSKVSNNFFLGLSAFLCLLLSFGADLGGLMVYGHGVNVNTAEQHASEPAALESEAEGSQGHSHGGHDHHHHHGGHEHDE